MSLTASCTTCENFVVSNLLLYGSTQLPFFLRMSHTLPSLGTYSSPYISSTRARAGSVTGAALRREVSCTPTPPAVHAVVPLLTLRHQCQKEVPPRGSPLVMVGFTRAVRAVTPLRTQRPMHLATTVSDSGGLVSSRKLDLNILTLLPTRARPQLVPPHSAGTCAAQKLYAREIVIKNYALLILQPSIL